MRKYNLSKLGLLSLQKAQKERKHQPQEGFQKENKIWLGRSHSQITKEKIRIKIKQRWLDPVYKERIRTFMRNSPYFKKNCIPWNKGKKWIELSQTRMGSGNPAWQGGKSFEPYPISFNSQLKNRVKERDNHYCQLCRTQKDLRIHHINYNKEDCNLSNLITLCKRCNTTVNGKRQIWTIFFKNKINIWPSYQEK